MSNPIYFDYNATTPLDPNVLEAMMPYLTNEYGNASSVSHLYGCKAAGAVEQSRTSLAKILNARPKEIFFTSGATESNNLALLGLMQNFRNTRSHMITSAAEHKSVLDVAKHLEKEGVELTVLPVNKYGQVSVADIAEATKPNTRLISIMMANNEVGTLSPVQEIGQLAKSKGIFFHTDATQSFGKMDIDVDKLGIDLLSVSAHKIYGPKGVGAVYIRSENPKVCVQPQQFGGAQEQKLRPGTLNVPGIVGLAKAAEIMIELQTSENKRLRQYQERIMDSVLKNLPSAVLNGHPTQRISNNLSFSFSGITPQELHQQLDGFALSAGSACISGSASVSHVLSAMGYNSDLASSTARIGLGRNTQDKDIEALIHRLLALAPQKSVAAK